MKGKFYGVVGSNTTGDTAYIDIWKRLENGEIVWDKIIEVPFYKLKRYTGEIVNPLSSSYYP